MTVRCQRPVTSYNTCDRKRLFVQYGAHNRRNLVKIGASDLPADEMKRIIAATDRAAAGPTAPAHGLTMIGLEYE